MSRPIKRSKSKPVDYFVYHKDEPTPVNKAVNYSDTVLRRSDAFTELHTTVDDVAHLPLDQNANKQMWAIASGRLYYTVNGRRRWDEISVVTHPGMVATGRVLYCTDTQKLAVRLPDGSLYTSSASGVITNSRSTNTVSITPNNDNGQIQGFTKQANHDGSTRATLSANKDAALTLKTPNTPGLALSYNKDETAGLHLNNIPAMSWV